MFPHRLPRTLGFPQGGAPILAPLEADTIWYQEKKKACQPITHPCKWPLLNENQSQYKTLSKEQKPTPQD